MIPIRTVIKVMAPYDNADTLTRSSTGGMAGVLAVRDVEEILLINPTIEKAHHFKEKLRTFGVDDSVKY